MDGWPQGRNPAGKAPGADRAAPAPMRDAVLRSHLEKPEQRERIMETDFKMSFAAIFGAQMENLHHVWISV